MYIIMVRIVHCEGRRRGTLVSRPRMYWPFRAEEHARGSAVHGCCRGLYDNAAGWIPPHYNMNSGHLRRLLHDCMCVFTEDICVCVWGGSTAAFVSFYYFLS